MSLLHGTTIFTNGPRTGLPIGMCMCRGALRKPTTSKWLWYDDGYISPPLWQARPGKPLTVNSIGGLQNDVFNAVMLIKAGCDSYFMTYNKPTLMAIPHLILPEEEYPIINLKLNSIKKVIEINTKMHDKEPMNTIGISTQYSKINNWKVYSTLTKHYKYTLKNTNMKKYLGTQNTVVHIKEVTKRKVFDGAMV